MTKIDIARAYIRKKLSDERNRLTLANQCYNVDDSFKKMLNDEIEQLQNVAECLETLEDIKKHLYDK